MESPHQGNESNNSSASTPRQEGTLLRVQQDFYDRLEKDNFNKTLFIGHLQEKITLLQSGDGYYVLDVLRELQWLRCKLQDGRQTIQRQARKIDEGTEEITWLKEQLRAKEASEKTQTRTEAELTITMLQESLGEMTQEKKQLADKAEDLRRQNKRLADELAAQGTSTAALKSDHERAMDTIYELETQVLERDNCQELETQIAAQHDEQCDLERMKREINVNRLEARTLKRKMAEAGKELRRAERDIQVLNEQEALYAEQLRDFNTLKAFNRLLYDEVQERRKQYNKMAKTSKNMREAIEIYQEAIAERDVEIEKHTLRLQERSPSEKALMEQLQETKAMLAAVSERLETSPIGSGDRAPLGCNLTLSDLARRNLKAMHGKRLSVLSKKLEDLTPQVEL